MKQKRQRGFTLIEILVVVTIITILLAVVVNSFSGVDREQTLKGYAERLALRIELARDKALQTNREWGVYIDEEGVRFAVFDEENGKWIMQHGRHFAADSYSTTLDFVVEVESFERGQSAGGLFSEKSSLGRLSLGKKKLLDNNNFSIDSKTRGSATDEDPQQFPTILLFSSGETTPFSIQLAPKDWSGNPWLLASDGFTRTEVSREDSGWQS